MGKWCVGKWCVSKWCGGKWYVSKCGVRRRRRRRREEKEEGASTQPKTRTPHKDVGEKKLVTGKNPFSLSKLAKRA